MRIFKFIANLFKPEDETDRLLREQEKYLEFVRKLQKETITESETLEEQEKVTNRFTIDMMQHHQKEIKNIDKKDTSMSYQEKYSRISRVNLVLIYSINSELDVSKLIDKEASNFVVEETKVLVNSDYDKMLNKLNETINEMKYEIIKFFDGKLIKIVTVTFIVCTNGDFSRDEKKAEKMRLALKNAKSEIKSVVYLNNLENISEVASLGFDLVEIS